METTQNDGLELFGNSEVVTDIADFLSLDDLGIGKEEPVIDLEPVDLPKAEKKEKEKEEDKEDVGKENPSKEEEAVDLNITEDIDLTPDENTPQGGVSDYKSLVKELMDSGVLDEIGAFETEDGEVSFDDMNIDKETFIALIKGHQEEVKNSMSQGVVSTEGLSDFTQKLIDIEKKGGDVQKALEAYQTIKEPLNAIDITEPRGQKAICYLRLQQSGITGEEAKDLIDSYEIKGVLEDKAYAFKDQLDQAFNSWMEEERERAIAEEKQNVEALKAYRSALNEALKNTSEFHLTETHRRKLLDIATKDNGSGELEIDSLLDNYRTNPNDTAELLLFLTDREGYIAKKTESMLKEERKKTLKTISVIPKSKSNLELETSKRKEDRGRFIPLEKLK